MLTEQIAFSFLAESCLQHSRSRRADAVRITERKLVSASAGVLMNREQRRHASALRIHAAQQVPRTLRRDHHYVDIFRRLDGFEVDREAMREAEDFPLPQVRLDCRLIEVSLRLVGRKNLDPVGTLGSFGGSNDSHAVGARLLGGPARRIKSDDYLVSTVTQVLCLRVSLRAVTENSDGLIFQRGRISVVLIKHCCHWENSFSNF